MNWNKRVRQTHRVVAMAFVATVVVTVAVMALQGPVWVSYIPLPPLALLLFSGLYLYVRPYIVARRGGRTDTTHGSTRTRALHRLSAACFAGSILITSATLALQGPMWVSYLPLLPLAALLFSGLFLFARPRPAQHPDDRAGRSVRVGLNP
ncbi:hypothetical protein [Nocardia carnea]|uniref:hypothetical protein n=1 Tax=Nocardia carnea TaxID=37328 RepID=UPI0024577FBB|nr:hypothetical protein [Nocardia carnea]